MLDICSQLKAYFLTILLLASFQAQAHLPSAKSHRCEALLGSAIRTENLEIRLLNDSDLPILMQVLQHPDVGPKMMLDVSESGIARMVSQPQGELHFGIYSLKDGVFLGMVSFWNPADEVLRFTGVANPVDYPGVELGYALAPAAWGKGIATEVASRMTTYALNAGWGERVYALTTADNAASKKVLIKAGFVESYTESDRNISWFEFLKTAHQ